MTGRQIGVLASVMTLLAILVAALGVYAQQQRLLSLESNRLLSGAAFQVEADAAAVIEELHHSECDAWVWSSVEDADSVLAVAADAIGSVPFPIHAGAGFSGDDGKEALVGASVETFVEDGVRKVHVLGGSYAVVGELGARQESILADTVVIHDELAVLDSGHAWLQIDGPDARAMYVERFGESGVEELASGSLHRTNIDFVSPQILGFGASLAAAGWLGAGALVGRFSVSAMQVRYILGERYRRLLTHMLTLVLTLSIASTAAVFAGSSLVAAPLPWTFALVCIAASAVLVSAASVLSVTFHWRRI